MPSLSKITTCLWFNNQAEEAAKHYTSIFPDSKITHTQRYSSAGQEVHGKEPGSVMVVAFELGPEKFVGLNGGPAQWNFSEAISFQIDCEDQAEVDHFWEKLGDGGDPARQRCGWLADRYGVSWQVVPKVLKRLLESDNREGAGRVTEAMMKMKKLNIEELQRAFEGN